eukprot:54766-Rhodomonas_salina.1
MVLTARVAVPQFPRNTISEETVELLQVQYKPGVLCFENFGTDLLYGPTAAVPRAPALQYRRRQSPMLLVYGAMLLGTALRKRPMTLGYCRLGTNAAIWFYQESVGAHCRAVRVGEGAAGLPRGAAGGAAEDGCGAREADGACARGEAAGAGEQGAARRPEGHRQHAEAARGGFPREATPPGPLSLIHISEPTRPRLI